jgi:hypothetical protein
MQKATFMLDPLGDQTFSGYTDGRLWNGWAVPSFSKEEAERIVNAWHDLGYKADYDEASDVFRFAPMDETGNPDPNLADEEEAEHFPSIMFRNIKLYPVGAGFWIWEEARLS